MCDSTLQIRKTDKRGECENIRIWAAGIFAREMDAGDYIFMVAIFGKKATATFGSGSVPAEKVYI